MTRRRPLPPGRWWLALVAIPSLLALHLGWLGAAPNPAGDEGNWALLGLAASRGEAFALPPEARFVTTLFARCIGWSFQLLGPSWASARIVPALAVVLGAAGLGAALATAGRPREGAVLALAVALHPWGVAWGRTVSVPYALPYVLTLLGAVALWRASLAPSRSRAFGWCLGASQALGLALQGSPLALTAALAGCVTLALEPSWRRPWKTPEGALAALLGALHALPLALSAATVQHASPPVGAPPEPLLARLASYANGALGGVSGEATVRHFAGSHRAAWALSTLAALGLLGGVLRPRDPLGRHALRWLGVSALTLPALLYSTRAWHLPTVDTDRYAFVFAAPMALCVACVPWDPRGRAAVALAALLWGAGSLRLAAHFAFGGAPDRGLSAWDGGPYRGWQPLEGHLPLPDTLREAALDDARGLPVALVYDDYAFHAVRFPNAVAGDHRATHRLGALAPVPGRRSYAVTFTAAPSQPVTGRIVRIFRHPDGSPWCALRALEGL
ncbi:MAG: hypothetical protein HY909_06280 [Deltaproteobacteria bacterium]|nr:hypothetical protein [Deltaproteobacteria bacterium]